MRSAWWFRGLQTIMSLLIAERTALKVGEETRSGEEATSGRGGVLAACPFLAVAVCPPLAIGSPQCMASSAIVLH